MKRVYAFLMIGWLCVLGSATTVVPMSIERLTDASTHVVEGIAEGSQSMWNLQHTQILTYTTFRVTRALKGEAPSVMVVKQMGGRADGYEQKVAGVRQFKSGEKAVLFVHPSVSNDGTVVITGLMQGNFSIAASQTGEATVSNGVAGVEQLSTGSVGHYAGAHLRLSQLESMVHATATRSQK
jgi:hypothetical protein